MPPNKNCSHRIHRWGPGKEGARVCLDCEKLEGKRGRKVAKVAESPHLPPDPIKSAEPPASSAPAALASTAALDAAAARKAKLAAKFGAVAPAAPSAEPQAQADQPALAPAEQKVLLGDLAELLGPLLPTMVIAIEQRWIERGGHIPNPPNADIQERFEACVIAVCRQYLPSVAMSPGKGALVTALALYASMRIGAEKMPEKTDTEKALRSVPVQEAAEVPTVGLPVATKAAAPATGPILSLVTTDSTPPEQISENPLDDGSAPNAKDD